MTRDDGGDARVADGEHVEEAERQQRRHELAEVRFGLGTRRRRSGVVDDDARVRQELDRLELAVDR